jgi:multicomponent Na+:H+ antiporter subunit E
MSKSVKRNWLKFRKTALYAFGFVALWYILSDGKNASWAIGLPVVVLATWFSVMLRPDEYRQLRWYRLLRFLPYFVWQSLRGSIDVAKRALHPRLPLAPDLLQYRMELSSENARILFANIISLLPGTLTADITGECITVHSLTGDQKILDELKGLERRIADMYALNHERSNTDAEVSDG